MNMVQNPQNISSVWRKNKARSHLRKVMKTNEQGTSNPIEIIRSLMKQ